MDSLRVLHQQLVQSSELFTLLPISRDELIRTVKEKG
jgi:hypothetical protein